MNSFSKMAALNKHHMLAVAIIILRRRRRRRQKVKERGRKFWIRPTNQDRNRSGAFILTFLPAKSHDREELFS